MMSADRRYFCVIGNSLEFPITQKGINMPRHILFQVYSEISQSIKFLDFMPS